MQEFSSNMFKEVSHEVKNFAHQLQNTKIGKSIRFVLDKESKSEYLEKIFILGVSIEQDSSEFSDNLSRIRKEFYSLFNPNWDLLLYDLGEFVLKNDSPESKLDFRKALMTLKHLPKAKVILFNNQLEIIKEVLQSFQRNQEIKWVHISRQLGFLENQTSEEGSPIKQCLLDENLNITDFTLLGFQNYFVAQEEQDLLRNLNFDLIRLGEITENLKIVEPELRNANCISLDFDSVQYPYFRQFYNTVNGFNSREICAISRYSGFSDELEIFSIFAFCNSKKISDTECQLISQVLWYFIEGTNQNWSENNFSNPSLFEVYNVLLSQHQIRFYKNIKTEKWWIGIEEEYKNQIQNRYLPCSENDYILACNNKLPKKWLRYLQK